MNILEIQNVSWTRDGNSILKNISWKIRKNEHWALVGLNGSGKTSLLKMICGYEWPSNGRIQVLGNTFGECEIQTVRKSLGWVSSSVREQIYPNDTVLEVAVSGKYATIGTWYTAEPDDFTKASEILAQINCEKLAHSRYGVLSQGEKQKVLLARALMAQPKLLILDEPCYGLDLRAREQFLQLLQLLKEKDELTIILVTHHIDEILPFFTHAALIENGEFVAAGIKENVLTEKFLQKTFHVDVKLDWNQGRPWVQVVKLTS